MHGYFKSHQDYLHSLKKAKTRDMGVRILLNDSENITAVLMGGADVCAKRELSM
jgi:phosphatidylserine/phosphatidylglycerophosphate/cardiolipin synthase-like enzyme